MTGLSPSLLADIVLYVHVAVILFNMFGLVAIPLGAWRGWRFVHVFWWRALHVASLGVVALQALLGRACFLTLWRDELIENSGAKASPTPLIQGWIMRLVFWPLPFWAFTMLYVLLWLYVLWLWRRAPPVRVRRRSGFRNP